MEYIVKYNLWNDVLYVTYKNCDGIYTNPSTWQRGTIRVGLDLVYNHYVNRLGLSAPYTQEGAEQVRPEGGGFNYGTNSGGFDSLGFTTLTHSRDPIAFGAVPSGLAGRVHACGLPIVWVRIVGSWSDRCGY